GAARRAEGQGHRDHRPPPRARKGEEGARAHMTTPWDQRLGVWHIAEDHPDLPAIVESPSGEGLTFSELAGRAHRVANALVGAGLERGEIVTMAFPNGVYMIVWQLAAQEVGLRFVMLNPALSPAE